MDTSALHNLKHLPVGEVEEMVCRAHLGVWTARRRTLPMSALHWEWTELRMSARRLAVVAPREHSKSETFTVNGTTWESVYTPGIWTYVFSSTSDQAMKMLDRIREAVEETAPWLNEELRINNRTEVMFANGSMVSVAGAGKSVRGAHPDVIIGDDVLEEETCATAAQRRKMEKWWLGTVGGMSHPGTWRTVMGKKVWMKPSRVFLVGTPFHRQDLLMNMRENGLYEYRRYAAEYEESDLAQPGKSLAVEIR